MGVRDGEDMAECMAGGVGGGSGGGTWEFGGAQGVRQCGCAWLGGRTRMSRLCAMGGEAHGGGCTWVTGPGGGVRTRPPAHPPPPPPRSPSGVSVQPPAVPPSPRVTQRAHSASICPSVCVGRVRSPPPPPPSPPFLMQSSAGGGAGSWVAAFIHCPRPHSVLSEGKIKGGVQAETPTHSQEGGGAVGAAPPAGDTHGGGGPCASPGGGGRVGLQGSRAEGLLAL